MSPEVEQQSKTPGRKPGQPTKPADQTAIANLQDAVSRLIWYISANPASALGIRLARCAKAGVDRARAERGLQLVEAAVATARTQLEAAYSAPKRNESQPAQRPNVSL